MNYKHYVIEGIDRLGKSSLLEGIILKYGYFNKLHYSKPLICEPYNDYQNPLLVYQSVSFYHGFELLEQKQLSFIFDRFTYGECVYSPLYREYSGDYVFSLERDYDVDRWDHVKVILLTTSDFSIIEDDGLSFDFSKKEQEQNMFIDTYEKSIFKHKQLIDVMDNGRRKSVTEIINEIT
jgi:hypothetical protein